MEAFAGAKVNGLCSTIKKFTGFSHIFVTRSLLCFGCFAAGQHADGWISLTHCNIYNWLANACILKTCERIAMSVLYFGNGVTFFEFLRFSLAFYSQVSRLIFQLEAWDDRGRRHTQTTNRSSIYSKSKQLFSITIYTKNLVEFPFRFANLQVLASKRRWAHKILSFFLLFDILSQLFLALVFLYHEYNTAQW